MTEMIERVARAIRAETRGIPDDGSPIVGDGADYVGIYTDVARAAIAAMREPTDRMVTAATVPGNIPYFPRMTWTLMIESAAHD
jgi:hypothetical protein